MNYHIISNTCLSLLMVTCSLAEEAPEKGRVSTRSGDIDFSVEYAKSYPDGMVVSITHTIKNATDHVIQEIDADRVYDRKFILTGPDGRLVTPYPFMLRMLSYGSRTLEPGESDAEEIELGKYFPFRVAGEYRCTVTRRVYDTATTSTRRSADGITGDPVDLTAPEFRFRVESSKHVERSTDPHGEPVRQILDGISGHSQPSQPSGSPTSKHAPQTGETDYHRSSDMVHPSTSGISARPSASRLWWLLSLPALVLLWLGLRSRKQS